MTGPKEVYCTVLQYSVIEGFSRHLSCPDFSPEIYCPVLQHRVVIAGKTPGFSHILFIRR